MKPLFASITTPGYRRSRLIRRLLALTLLLIAGVSALSSRGRPVVTTTHDIAVGTILTASDVTTVRAPADVIPPTALVDPTLAIGTAAVVGLGTGQMLTQTTVTGEGLFHEDDTMVPIRLADPAIAPLLEHGLLIDVVATDGAVVATGARVVVASKDDPGTVLIALPPQAAHTVAAASLAHGLTVVLAGR